MNINSLSSLAFFTFQSCDRRLHLNIWPVDFQANYLEAELRDIRVTMSFEGCFQLGFRLSFDGSLTFLCLSFLHLYWWNRGIKGFGRLEVFDVFM